MSCSRIGVSQKGADLPVPKTREAPLTFVFVCERNFKFIARFEDEQAWLFLPEKTVSVSPVPSGTVTKYSDGNISFWHKGDEAWLEISPDVYHACRNNRYLSIWEHAKLNGVDFRAVGNEPGWHLEITSGRKIVFVSDYGQSRYEFDTPEPTSAAKKRKTTYIAENKEHSLGVVIIGQPCRDSMRGDLFESTVAVTLDGRDYRGCGKALH